MILKNTKNIVSELERRKKFFEGERSRLEVESIMENSPTRKFIIEENKREAEEELELTQKALDKIQESSINDNLPSEKNNSEKNKNLWQKNKLPLKPSKRIQNCNNTSTDDWYKKPIGIIGITVFSGIIIILAVYLIRTHLGIPL
ncbi:MAG: hypothetical protein HQK72_06130 [Desulfamplus sp.]|nr:hypothetical protein [Desulfamplus sp.]